MKLKKGYIHIYTGDGKGKTTCALGLALRAAGAGLKVYIGQFIKNGSYSEVKILKKLSPLIRIEQFGRGCFIAGKPEKKDIALARKALKRVASILAKGLYDVVILDEINVAISRSLLSVNDVIDALKHRTNQTEVVLTGRNAPKKLLQCADLVTEMKEVKHYYKKGVKARPGIEN